MKLFAFKQQKHNPLKPTNINGELVWLKEIIDESQTQTYIADNWVVLDSDDFRSYLLQNGKNPDLIFI